MHLKIHLQIKKLIHKVKIAWIKLYSVYNRLISYRFKYGGIRVKKRMNLKNMVIIILIAILVISYVRQELTMNKIHKDIEAKQTQLNELQDKNKKLQDEVNQSSTDEYIERMARERLGMIKDGEKVITNSDSPQDKQNNSEAKNNQNK